MAEKDYKNMSLAELKKILKQKKKYWRIIIKKK